MAAMSAGPDISMTVVSNDELIEAFKNEAVTEIIIGAPFTIYGRDAIEITRPLILDGRGHNMGMRTGLAILSDAVTIKNLNITVANVSHILVFDIGNYKSTPKDILIEHCNIVGKWEGERSRFGGGHPYHSAISVREKTRVTVKDSSIKKCAMGVTVSDFAICILQRVTFEDNNIDKELLAEPLMYGGVATPTGEIQEVTFVAKYKQFIK